MQDRPFLRPAIDPPNRTVQVKKVDNARRNKEKDTNLKSVVQVNVRSGVCAHSEGRIDPPLGGTEATASAPDDT